MEKNFSFLAPFQVGWWLSSGPLAPGLRLLIAVLGAQLLGVGRECSLGVEFMRNGLAFWMSTFLMQIYKLTF